MGPKLKSAQRWVYRAVASAWTGYANNINFLLLRQSISDYVLVAYAR